jgi:chromosome segregation ATPase
MTNTQTIEKLNEGLVQLIEAYKQLQSKNDDLENEISQLKAQKSDLEYKLSDFNSSSDEQQTKMDGMLNTIQTLLKPSSKDTTVEIEIKQEDIQVQDDNSSLLDIKLDIKQDEQEEEVIPTTSNKVDLGRMESLLSGMNNN